MAAIPTKTSDGFLRHSETKQAAPAGEDAVKAAHAKLNETFRTGRTKSFEWRKAQLEGIRRLCVENGDEVVQAIKSDLGRPKMEAFLGDVSAVIAEVDYHLAHLASWMKPEAVPTPMVQQPGRSTILREPKGVVLQLAPWNFPLNLSLMGLIAVTSAGNCSLLKPSEIAPSTEDLLCRLLPKYVDKDAIIVIPGGVPEATALLAMPWDHILYTGNGAVGRVVARAAAEHLTPITLELGGKSPTVVLPGANIQVAARRILCGKFFNAGQICIAPDYALVHKDVEAEMVAEMQRTLATWYGEDAKQSDSFGRIVNQRHFDRVKSLIDSAGDKVLPQQGTMDRESKFIPPTLVREPNVNSALMKEEIFGPVLPILKMDSLSSIVKHINSNDKPLALYVFGNESDADKVISQTSSGGVCVNDTIFHITNHHLPFGGVGSSGMGRYHGKWGFDEFSHIRSVMYRATWVDPSLRYPPYTDSNMKFFEKMLVGPLLPPWLKKAIKGVSVAGVAAAAVAVLFALV